MERVRTVESGGTEEFSFQQSFGERFARATANAAPFAAGALGYFIAMLALPGPGLNLGVVLFCMMFTMVAALCYALWMAWTYMYLEGPRIGLRDMLRTASKSLVVAFVGGGAHVFAQMVMKH